MKVFIAGGYNVFVSQLVEKFNKEGWEVHLLTGTKSQGKRHPGVFEQYDFPYDSDSIKDVLDSATPDLVIFTGAYDGNFSSRSTRRESMYYVSGLINILMAAQMLGVKSFAYISSHEVFEESYLNPVTEEEPPTPLTTRGMLIAQGENLVIRYGETSKMDTTVLRLDHLYWLPRNRKEVSEPHAQLCLAALKDRKIPASEKKIFSSLFVADAVFAVYAILTREQRQHRVYHLTSGQEENEMEIAGLVRDCCGYPVVIKDNTVGLTKRNIMADTRIKEEFGISTRFGFRDRIPFIMDYMNQHKQDFLLYEEYQGSWLRQMWHKVQHTVRMLLPFAENGAVFLLVFLLNNRTADSEYFRRLDVFLLYVVLFALFYGKRQAILAAFLSTLGFIFRQSYYRTGVEVLVDYNIYIWMAQLFIVGMAVGHLRDSIRLVEEDKNEQIVFLTGQLEDIYDINSTNLKVKNILEDHIISYGDSLGTLQSLTKSLDTLDPGEALYKAADVLCQVLQTDSVAIYKISNGDYCRLMAATTQEARELGKSFRYSQEPELVESMKKREVYVNRTLRDHLPMLAYGLGTQEKTEYIIMVWNLRFEQMSLRQMDLLKTLGDMIESTITRSGKHLEALSDKRYISGTDILKKAAFEEQLQTARQVAQRGYAEISLVWIRSAKLEGERTDRHGMLERISDILSKNLRETDAVGVGKDGRVYMLLTNSGAREAQVVIDRLEEKGIRCELKERL